MSLIVTKNVSMNFGRFSALKNINLEIGRGEIVGFLGQNGAGKTTLMRVLTTFYMPSAGQVFIDGKDTQRESLAVRANIGYLPENPPLYPSMTVKDYLIFAAQLKKIPRGALMTKVEKVLNECQLLDVVHKPIAHLSKGYRQRVGIAQAIIHDPAILILDEPTSGLDPLQIRQVRELIKNLEEKRTVILSTHILSEIEQMAQRVIVIKSGEIIVDGLLNELLRKPHDSRRLKIRMQGNVSQLEDIVRSMKGIKKFSLKTSDQFHEAEFELNELMNDNNALIERVLAMRVQIKEIEEDKISLEEVFLKMHPPSE